MRSNFLLGEIVVTAAARRKLGREPLDLVARHAVNEHGSVSLRQLKRNLKGLTTGDEIVSRYAVDPTDPTQGFVLVVTHPSWGSTTVKLETEA